MHASLAVAFMYDRHLNGPLGDRGSLEECYHRAQSIALLNQRLRDPIEEKDKDPIWGTAAALGILTFSSPDARTPEESWPLKSSGPSTMLYGAYQTLAPMAMHARSEIHGLSQMLAQM